MLAWNSSEKFSVVINPILFNENACAISLKATGQLPFADVFFTDVLNEERVRTKRRRVRTFFTKVSRNCCGGPQ